MSEGKQSWSQAKQKKQPQTKHTYVLNSEETSNHQEVDLEVIRVTIWFFVLKVSGCFSPSIQSFLPWDTESPSLPLEPVRSVPGEGRGEDGVGRSLVFLNNLIKLWLTLHLALTL